LTYSEKARIRDIYPTFGFADQSYFRTSMDI
jgi:AraC-like DNA-binding protein